MVEGEGAKDLLQYVTTNNIDALENGKAQYSCLPNGNGGIVDDLIIYKIEDNKYFLVVNAANIDKDWNLHIEKNSIVVNSRMETNIPGIYAVGDICTYEGKVKLIISGFGEAPTAVSNAKVYIDPSAKIQAIHSTSLMENKKEAITTKCSSVTPEY